MSPRRVAVIRFSSVGDIVLTTPALHALKRALPETEILYVTKPAMRPLIAHSPHVDSLVYLEKDESPANLARRIRELEPDALVDLHGTLRSRLLRWSLRGIRQVVWQKRPWGDNIPVRLGWRPYRAAMPISDRYHAAMEALVGESIPRGELRYVVGSADQDEADRALRDVGVSHDEVLIGLSPGAKWETKRWPIERFCALADRIHNSGWRVVVTGSRDEEALSRAIIERVPAAVSLTGGLTLGALGGVIARCTAFVANDSGPMHIARGLGVPTLAFFGTTDPKQFEFAGHALMYASEPCSPCHFYGRERCPKGHFRCMTELSVDSAWDALVGRVEQGRVPLVHA
ncbi:MAG: glycosyltransferase family 9 protein [Myxococcota bacterium]